MSAGQAVGQDVVEIHLYRDGTRYQLLTLMEVSKITGIPQQTLRDGVSFGELIGMKIGRDWFIDKSLIKKSD